MKMVPRNHGVFALCFPGFGLWTLDFGLWTLDSGLWTLDSLFQRNPQLYRPFESYSTGDGDPDVQEDVAQAVYPVLEHVLNVRQRLHRGEEPDLAAERATLERMLDVDREARRYSDLAAELDIRYALVCWIDELFIQEPRWGQAWNERKLEVTVFNSNDRAWKFWEKARRALTRSEHDALEVFYLTVMLGFRGELRERPEELRSWSSAAKVQLSRSQTRSWAAPPDLEPPTQVPPLQQRERLRSLVMRASIVLVLAVPLVVFSVIRLLMY